MYRYMLLFGVDANEVVRLLSIGKVDIVGGTEDVMLCCGVSGDHISRKQNYVEELYSVVSSLSTQQHSFVQNASGFITRVSSFLALSGL